MQMANSEDPDQTAPLGADCSSRSSLVWVCTVCPDLSVRKFRIITVCLFVKLKDPVNMSMLFKPIVKLGLQGYTVSS